MEAKFETSETSKKFFKQYFKWQRIAKNVQDRGEGKEQLAEWLKPKLGSDSEDF